MMFFLLTYFASLILNWISRHTCWVATPSEVAIFISNNNKNNFYIKNKGNQQGNIKKVFKINY